MRRRFPSNILAVLLSLALGALSPAFAMRGEQRREAAAGGEAVGSALRGESLTRSASGLEEHFQFPPPTGDTVFRPDLFNRYAQGNPEFPSEPNVLQTFFPEGGFLELPFKVWDQPVPAALLDHVRSGDWSAVLSPYALGDVDLRAAAAGHPAMVQELLRVLRENGPTLSLHYQLFPKGEAAPQRWRVEAVPVSVRAYHPRGDSSAERQLEIRYVARIPVDGPADVSVTTELLLPPLREDNRLWTVDLSAAAQRMPPDRLDQELAQNGPAGLPSRAILSYRPGDSDRPVSSAPIAQPPASPSRHLLGPPRVLIRVSDGQEIGSGSPQMRPRELKQFARPDGSLSGVVLYPAGEDRKRAQSWSGTGLGRRMQHRHSLGPIAQALLGEARAHWTAGQRVSMVAHSSLRAGAVFEEGDIIDLGELAGLLPVNPQESPLTWDYRSGNEAPPLLIGVRREPARGSFVIEAASSGDLARDVQRVAGQAEQIIRWLAEPVGDPFPGEPIPDFNLWAMIREEGTVRLVILPRLPESSDANGMPVVPPAAEPYYAVRIPGGIVRLMTVSEIAPYDAAAPKNRGFGPFDPVAVDVGPKEVTARLSPRVIQRGEGILNLPIDGIALFGGLVLGQKPTDPNAVWPAGDQYASRHLPALLSKAIDLVGAPLDHPRVLAVRERVRMLAGNDPVGSLERARRAAWSALDHIENAEQLIDAVRRIRDTGRRFQEGFDALSPEERDGWTRRFLELILQFEGGRVRIQMPGQGDAGETAARGEEIPTVMALGAPTLDIVAEVVGDGAGAQLTVSFRAGGSPAHMAQAIHALGLPAHLIAAYGDVSGEKMLAALAGIGVPVTPVQGRPTRGAGMLPRSEDRRELRLVGIGKPSSDPAREMDHLWAEVSAAAGGKPYVVVAGERLPQRAGYPNAAAQALAQQIKHSRAPVYLSVNPSWSREEAATLLDARPRGVFMTPEGLARVRRDQTGDLDAWRNDPDRIALLAHDLFRHHGIRDWVFVALESGGAVLVSNGGWWHISPSPLQQLTYTSGAADTAFGMFLAAVTQKNVLSSRGIDPLAQAASVAVTAAAAFMSRSTGPAQGELLAAAGEAADGFLHAEWPVVVERLPMPEAVRREEERFDQAGSDLNDEEIMAEAFQRFTQGIPIARYHRDLAPEIIDSLRDIDPALAQWAARKLELSSHLSALPVSRDPGDAVGYLLDAPAALVRAAADRNNAGRPIRDRYRAVASGLRESRLLVEQGVPSGRIFALVADQTELNQLRDHSGVPEQNIRAYNEFSGLSWDQALNRVWDAAEVSLSKDHSVDVVRSIRTNSRTLSALMADLREMLPPAWLSGFSGDDQLRRILSSLSA